MDSVCFPSAAPSAIVGAWSWDLGRDHIAAWLSLGQLLCLEDVVLRKGVTLNQFLSAVHPADRDRIDEAVGKAVSDATTLDEICRVVTAGLGVRSIHLQGAFHLDEFGRPLIMTGVVRETTNLVKPPGAMIVEHLIEARRYAVAAEKRVLSKLIEATLYEAGLELAASLRNTFVDRLNH